MSNNIVFLFSPIEKLSDLTGRPLHELKAWVRVAQGDGTFNVRANTRHKSPHYCTRDFLAWHRNLTLRAGLALPQPMTAA